MPNDFNEGATGQVTFTPGGPNRITTQLRVLNDQTLEFDEMFLLKLSLPSASVTAGGQLGLKNTAEVTIINDDCKTKVSKSHKLYVHMQYVCFTVVQVFFTNDTITIDESSRSVTFTLGFAPQATNIQFTVIVETFDLTPPDARGYTFKI